MKIKIIALALVSLLTLSFAITEDEIKGQMAQKIDKALIYLKDATATTDQKTQNVFTLFDEMFDFDRMASLSLGKEQWSMLNVDQKKEFSKKFIDRLKESYIEKMKLYTDEKVTIEDAKKVNENRIQLPVVLFDNNGSRYDILYKFYDTKTAKSWLIYDVDILGVSIIQTYRSQFDNILKTGSFEDLMKKIEVIEIESEK